MAPTTTPSPQSSGARVSFPAPNPTAASTHGCCPGAAASPRSCPSAAWRGSPAQAALGPPAAEPGSGQQRGARRRVSSCCGHRDCRRGLWSQRPESTLPRPPPPPDSPAPHQCSMTTAGPSASFSRLSTVSAGEAFRFLPLGAMVGTFGGRCNVGLVG